MPAWHIWRRDEPTASGPLEHGDVVEAETPEEAAAENANHGVLGQTYAPGAVVVVVGPIPHDDPEAFYRQGLHLFQLERIPAPAVRAVPLGL